MASVAERKKTLHSRSTAAPATQRQTPPAASDSRVRKLSSRIKLRGALKRTQRKQEQQTNFETAAVASDPETVNLQPHPHSSTLAVRAGVTRTWLLNQVLGTKQAMEGLAGMVNLSSTPRVQTSGRNALPVYLFGTKYDVAEDTTVTSALVSLAVIDEQLTGVQDIDMVFVKHTCKLN
jgi:hypothetical protein